jgi:hypothetical protein
MIERYKILEQLGEGGTGSVHKAWDAKLQRHVAIKVLLSAGERGTQGAGEDLTAEAAALSALQHPNIVAVYDLDTDGPEPFVVMEYINGETLEATVRRGALLPEDFQQIAAETLEGLIAAHKQGMCHRDIKPSNIMFHWLQDGKWQTKLLDFGLANFGLRPAQQQTAGEGTVAGSVHFMAPEQFLHQPLDVRTDLYSLGCVLYYSLTGSFPCNGATMEEVMNAHLARQVAPLAQLRLDVTPLLTDWVMWLMSRQPEERPESAAEALRVLRGIQSGQLTSLPTQRALKTQVVQKRTAVVAAPLSNARAAAGTTTGVIPTPPPAQGKPAAARYVAPRGNAPANAPEPAAKAAKPAVERPKSKLPLVAGLAVLLLGGGAAAYYFMNKPAGDSPGAEALPEAAGAPPEKGLVVWFDAGKGTRKDNGSTVAKPGDQVDQWDDRAALAGNNPAQYHASSTKEDEKLKRYPTLHRVKDADGLKGTHDVMTFNGKNCLIFARDRDGVGDPVASDLGGNELTWIIVLKASADPGQQGVLSARVGEETKAWDTFLRDGAVHSGVRKKGGADNHASLPFDAAKGYHILTVVWGGESDRLRQWLTGPDGKTAHSTAVSGTTDFGDVAEIRIGALNRAGGLKYFLDGGIASLLMYNRALDPAEREAAVDYLSRRYFGVPAAK